MDSGLINGNMIFLSEWGDQDWIHIPDTRLRDGKDIIYFDVLQYSQFVFTLTESEYVEYMLTHGKPPMNIEDVDISTISRIHRSCKGFKDGLEAISDKTLSDYVKYLLEQGCTFEP